MHKLIILDENYKSLEIDGQKVKILRYKNRVNVTFDGLTAKEYDGTLTRYFNKNITYLEVLNKNTNKIHYFELNPKYQMEQFIKYRNRQTY